MKKSSITKPLWTKGWTTTTGPASSHYLHDLIPRLVTVSLETLAIYEAMELKIEDPSFSYSKVPRSHVPAWERGA